MKSPVILLLFFALFQAVIVNSYPVVSSIRISILENSTFLIHVYSIGRPQRPRANRSQTFGYRPRLSSPHSGLFIHPGYPSKVKPTIMMDPLQTTASQVSQVHSSLRLARKMEGTGQTSAPHDEPAAKYYPGPPTWKDGIKPGPPTWRNLSLERKSQVGSPSERYHHKPGPPTWRRSPEVDQTEERASVVLEHPEASASSQYIAPGPPTWKA